MTRPTSNPKPSDAIEQRAELARICDNQIAARQSKKFEAANLEDIAAAADRDTRR